MLLHERMEHTYFPPSEQIIVNYLLTEELNISDKTTAQIAKETFSSKSTIVKVAKRLQFTGWSDFKKAYIAELTYLQNHEGGIDANYPFDEKENLLRISQKIAQLKQEAIAETQSLLNFKVLKQITDILLQAKNIHLFALSNNLYLSKEFQYNMARIRRRVEIHDILGEGIFAATLALPEECAIIISYSGESTQLVHFLEILRKNRVTTILITNIGDSTMARMADYTLRIATKERLYTKIATYANDASITYLLDVLYSCVFQKDYHTNVELRRKSSSIFETSRISQHGIKE
ncbi:MurR/RpiR family transcriptional regulator [Streptococcus sp. ZJ93]|uniref:MurR/RpiR family transcriptional regulator n=1 Tax=Streptococcus handemini TaxID=3161188 RepID=UPI0032EE9D04